jgi:hypothetical protein
MNLVKISQLTICIVGIVTTSLNAQSTEAGAADRKASQGGNVSAPNGAASAMDPSRTPPEKKMIIPIPGTKDKKLDNLHLIVKPPKEAMSANLRVRLLPDEGKLLIDIRVPSTPSPVSAGCDYNQMEPEGD